MKNITTFIIALIISLPVMAQSITGMWNGILKIQGTELRLVFNITTNDTGFTATMDSPDQGAQNIPVTSTLFINNQLTLQVAQAGITYTGQLNNNVITGTFKQSGYEFPLTLTQETIEKKAGKRPQEPTPPYPYYTEEVIIKNTSAGITLAGTLSLPAKTGYYPAVVLITGSGPQNRDEELMGHKPFLVIADHLTRNGIAVLRFDDRGVGQSAGDFKNATTADFATDVKSAVDFLKTRKEINNKKIGLIGHSEGGIIAPMVASTTNDIDFIVMLAGTGITGAQLLLLQQQLILKASGASPENIKKTFDVNSKAFEIVHTTRNNEALKNELTAFLNQSFTNNEIPKGVTREAFVEGQLQSITSPWMLYFLRHDPAINLMKVKCPVLAINGEKDLQVPPKENLAAIEHALKKGGNKNVTIMEFKNLNHLFQESITGTPAEYATIEQTIAPIVLTEITNWIKKQ